MDLAPLLLAGVRDAGSAQLSDKQFKALVSHADDLIQASLLSAPRSNNHRSANELSQLPAGVDAVLYKSSLGGVSALLLQAASLDSTSSDITSVLEDANWPSSRVSLLLAFFDSVRPLYRSTVLPSLSSFSTTVPHLTTASYQLDYYLRSNLAEQIRQPVIFLHLNTTAVGVAAGDSGRSDGVVSFSATAEELHDLLAKVKEAVRAAQQRHDE